MYVHSETPDLRRKGKRRSGVSDRTSGRGRVFPQYQTGGVAGSAASQRSGSLFGPSISFCRFFCFVVVIGVGDFYG